MDLAACLGKIRETVQVDVGNRGLARRPDDNLFTAYAGDLESAARSLVETPRPVLRVVTGFWIPSAQRGETDGPLGAVYLARTLPALGIEVELMADPFCQPALEAGLRVADERARVTGPSDASTAEITHLLALERVGPAHTPASVREQGEEALSRFLAEVPAVHHGRCHTMRGIDISEFMTDVSGLFERRPAGVVTIGIGDGGNEIGMGKIPWEVIARDVPGGAAIACRVRTDHLLVGGISNWGAYALAAAVAAVAGFTPAAEWFDLRLERRILDEMVTRGGLVDGVTGQAAASVDGLAFDDYAAPLWRLERVLRP